MSNILRRKSVEAFQNEMANTGLKRVLGKWGLTAIGIGAIIGTGIFVLTGLGARDHAGPALALSFVVAGFACVFAALCYAEFASFLPVEGSAYAYSYATMGELFAWIIGWDLILEYAMGSSAVAVGWSNYLIKVLGYLHVQLPLWLSSDYFTAQNIIHKAEILTQLQQLVAQTTDLAQIKTQAVALGGAQGDLYKTIETFTTIEQVNIALKGGTMTDLQRTYSSLTFPKIGGISIAFNLPAFLIIWLATSILIKGIKEATSVNNIMVIVKTAVVVFIIVAGAGFISPENWDPFIPERTSSHLAASGKIVSAFGFAGILSGAAYIFFAYIGFDVVATSAGESKNPQKDVPFGILASLIFCTILYILVSLVLTGMVKYSDIDIKAPIADAFSKRDMHWASVLISAAAIAGLTSVLIAMLLGQSRVFYAMAKDGLLPKKVFAALHSKFQTPYKSSLIIGVMVSLVSAFTPIEHIAEMTNIGTLLAFVMVCGAVLIMRIKQPNLHRPFKTPLIWFVAPMGILLNLAMMFNLDLINWIRLVVWLGIGFVIYFLYSYKHSNLNQNTTNN